MADKDKEPKMVPEWQLLKIKDKSEKLEKELSEANTKMSKIDSERNTLQAKVKTLMTDLEDEGEVKELREYLLQKDGELTDRENKFKEQETSVSKRGREVRAKELAIDLKSKGVEFDDATLLGAEDMEKHASDLYVEFLAKENEKLKTTPQANSPEAVFESGEGAHIKKTVAQMTDAEFTAHWNAQKQEALSRK